MRSLGSIVVLILDELRANRLRGGLLAVCVGVGVSALTLVVAAGDAAQAQAVAFVEARQGRAATLEVTDQTTEGSLDDATTALLQQRADQFDVNASTTLASRSVTIATAGRQVPGTLTASDPKLPTVRRITLSSGRWFTDHDRYSHALPAVVSDDVAATAGQRDVTVTIGTAPIRVVVTGVVASNQGSEQTMWVDRTAYADVAATYSLEPLSPSSVLWVVPDDDTDRFLDVIDQDLDHIGTAAEVRRVDDTADFEELITGQRLLLGVIAAITMIVAILAILNVGLVTVRQRSRDLAVLRSLGATRRAVFALVIGENIGIAMVGGIMGLGVAAALQQPVAQMFVSVGTTQSTPATFPVWAALTGLLGAVSIGVAGGALPAWRAARMEVVDGLRQ